MQENESDRFLSECIAAESVQQSKISAVVVTILAHRSGYNFNASGANIGYAITSKLFYGMVTPFINTSVAGWIW